MCNCLAAVLESVVLLLVQINVYRECSHDAVASDLVSVIGNGL